MALYALTIIYALFVWWFSTGAILYLDGLPRSTFRWSMLGATALLAAALYGLAATANDTTVGGAFLAFSFGILAWGWHEISFLMGYVTGPRKSICPPEATGAKRFFFAVQTILYHELAILASAAAILALTWQGENFVGVGTFFTLWGMRLSAKLNLFLGVRNLGEKLLPESLLYLKSFMLKKPMNPLFPFSVTIATGIAVLLAASAISAPAGSFAASAFTFLATLMALAVLEHWFMVLPLPAEALWKWGMRSHEAHRPDKKQAGGQAGGRPGPPAFSHLGAASASTSLPARPVFGTAGAPPPGE
ncbi:putative photosynthetic complex assembly protein PuhE [Afifella pfennigii]|uniref:putative photosynthetic complex assembly protein PuhE n=1 Tax=Afifella pfennigii TaxID=209897 RepID=UPI00068AE3A2|nr:putative photosynthetic complex assembly protein PuhE [Afifella pfennigii]